MEATTNWWLMASAISAAIAAAFWFASAFVKLPEQVQHILIMDGEKSEMDDLDHLIAGLRRQSRLSSFGAVAAGVAALLQVIDFFV